MRHAGTLCRVGRWGQVREGTEGCAAGGAGVAQRAGRAEGWRRRSRRPLDEVVVDGDGGGGSLAGGGDDLGAGVDGVPGGPDTRDAGAAGRVGARPSRCRRWRSPGRSAGRRWARTGDGRTPRPAARPGRSRARRRSGGRPRRRGGRPGPSTTPMARATSCSRSSAVSASPSAKKTTSSDHWRTSWACATASGVPPSTPRGWSRTSYPWQYGQWSRSRPHRSRTPGMSGSSSRSPVVTRTRRARSARPSARVTSKPRRRCRRRAA